MKRFTLTTKISILAGLAIIVASVSVATFATRVTSSEITDLTMNNIATTEYGVIDILDNWRATLEASTLVLADKTRLVTALSNNDFDTVESLTEAQMEVLDLETLLVTDENGLVVGGGKRGVNLASSRAVSGALRGSITNTYERTELCDYSQLVAYPIKSNGKVVGTVVGGYSLITDEFVNEIKEYFEVECTIFEGSTRRATTLGSKYVGTTLANQTIVDLVMSKGERYEGENVIDGVHYLSAYAPLAGDDGTITGMLFIAKSRAVVTNAVHQIVNLVIPVVTALVIVLMIIAGLFLRKFLKPLKGVKETLNDISSGDADLTKRITLKTHDEIGDVVTGFNTFSEKLQHIIGDVKSSKDDLVVAGEDLSGATQDTASSITQIITNIDSLRGQIDGQSQSVSQTAGAVNEIASNIESLDRMVSQQANDVTQASAAVEQMIGNISSVNASVDKMASSFGALQQNAQSGIGKQQAVNERIQQIEQQSAMLQEANAAISAIAEQTNLLAMNAAIEAAHAGDAGKGFSVVADEIRKLSETSTSQSKTIGDQLNNIKDSIAEVVSASADSSAAFESVSRLIKETDQLVTQIKSAMEEQQEGSQQITEALHSMNDSTVSVRNASNEMQEGNEMILKEVTQLQNASLAMTQRMEEMSIGARKINETGAALSDVANKISDSIQKIGVQVDQFKV